MLSTACQGNHHILTESSMHSRTVLAAQDLACVLLLVVILCLLIVLIMLYRAIIYWEPRVNHKLPVKVSGRHYRRRIYARNPYNQIRYPTEHDEHQG